MCVVTAGTYAVFLTPFPHRQTATLTFQDPFPPFFPAYLFRTSMIVLVIFCTIGSLRIHCSFYSIEYFTHCHPVQFTRLEFSELCTESILLCFFFSVHPALYWAVTTPFDVIKLLCENQFCVDDFHRTISDVVHGSDQCCLILCLEPFIDAFFLSHLRYKQIYSGLCLGINVS